MVDVEPWSSANVNFGIYSYLVTTKSPPEIYIITGRNEVVAKVMFSQVSVIHSVHRGGSPENPPGRENPRAGRTPPSRENPPGRENPPRTRQTPPPVPGRLPWGPGRPPPRKKTAAYGLWVAGTHPTGMHSCSFSYDRTSPSGFSPIPSEGTQ